MMVLTALQCRSPLWVCSGPGTWSGATAEIVEEPASIESIQHLLDLPPLTACLIPRGPSKMKKIRRNVFEVTLESKGEP